MDSGAGWGRPRARPRPDRAFTPSGGWPLDDLLEGGIGKDTIHGHEGPDTMRGVDGDDTIVSNASVDDGSPDVLEGNGGNDTLLAPDGVGNDVLNGGPGQDRCDRDSGDQALECETGVVP